MLFSIVELAFDNVHHTLDIMSFAFSENDFEKAKTRLDAVVKRLNPDNPDSSCENDFI